MDTNVAIVANGRPGPARGARPPSAACRRAAIMALIDIVQRGVVALDLAGAMQAEYARHLNPHGQPGVGDRFFLEVLNSMPGRVERVDLPLSPCGDYIDFPTDPALTGFDRSDRKFAAMSRRCGIPVLVATDSDWVGHKTALQANGVVIDFLCTDDPACWFAPASGAAGTRKTRSR